MFETKTIQHDGFTIRIDVEQDADYTPHDADCFSPEDIQAWENDEWHFVGYVYTAMKNGVELGSASIWGSPWGYGDESSSIDSWIKENYYHPDLLNEATTEARATLAQLTA